MKYCLIFRCNEGPEYKKYDELNAKLTYASENELFDLTGCLSTCDKFEYSVRPMTDLTDGDSFEADSETDLNLLTLKFYFASGRHEVKEQVLTMASCDVNDSLDAKLSSLAVCNLRPSQSNSRRRRLLGPSLGTEHVRLVPGSGGLQIQ